MMKAKIRPLRSPQIYLSTQSIDLTSTNLIKMIQLNLGTKHR